ncbi:MAG: hypothetical protein ABIJ27_01900 [Candidatus Omnitrophota bacterium]
MKKLAKPAIIIAMILAVIGGISKITLTPIVLTARGHIGAAVILLLLAIAIGVNE